MLRPLQEMIPLDQPEVLKLTAVFTAAGAIMQHFLGLVDVTMLATGLVWMLDMFGGIVRSMVRGFKQGVPVHDHPIPRLATGWEGALKALDWARFIEGLGKLLAIGIAVSLFGLLEVVMIDTRGFTIPMVVPIMFGAIALLSWSIADQVYELWPGLGKLVKRAIRKEGGS